MKTGKDLEKYFKGLANHRRIDILIFVAKNPRVTVEYIAEALGCNFQTIAVHLQKLTRSDFIEKKYRGRAVQHTISDRGKKYLSFISTL
jgi:predicted transcriptional regulator